MKIAGQTRSHSGFTLIELLIVLGIIALLAALLFPVFMQVRANSRQTTCASNMRQIGAALLAYMQDHDETVPNGRIPPTIFANHHTFPMNAGWAGRTYPYLKNTDLLHCPDDPTTSRTTSAPDPKQQAVPVSYGINLNMALSPQSASWTAAAHTVFLFEVVNNTARVLLPDEGMSGSLAYPDTTSAAGEGIGLWDLGTITPPDSAPDKGYVTKYATGYLDNHKDRDVPEEWVFARPTGRHRDGTSYLAADGHVVWLRGEKVSAGHTGRDASQEQSRTDCKNIGGFNGFPCAEGTGVGKHTLTFSTK